MGSSEFENMNLSIGIVGLPNVGKSTLFNILTKQQVTVANYPFATIHPNVGVVPVPDERLGKLAAMSRSQKTIPAIVEFYDIAGLVKDAHKGAGLGNQFLGHIKECQAIVIVLRLFQHSEIIHVAGSVDPLRDLEIIESELALKDLDTLERRLEKTERDARSQAQEAKAELDAIKKAIALINAGRMIANEAEKEISAPLTRLGLITAKKQIFLLNGREEDAPTELLEKIRLLGGEAVIADLKSAADVPELIRKSYTILNLLTFFTTGEKETRAWTTRRGSTAPQAAGAIHSDFERKFIRAEIVHTEELLASGGWNQARQKGLIRTEGKNYIIQDGDVMIVRHG